MVSRELTKRLLSKQAVRNSIVQYYYNTNATMINISTPKDYELKLLPHTSILYPTSEVTTVTLQVFIQHDCRMAASEILKRRCTRFHSEMKQGEACSLLQALSSTPQPAWLSQANYTSCRNLSEHHRRSLEGCLHCSRKHELHSPTNNSSCTDKKATPWPENPQVWLDNRSGSFSPWQQWWLGHYCELP